MSPLLVITLMVVCVCLASVGVYLLIVVGSVSSKSDDGAESRLQHHRNSTEMELPSSTSTPTSPTSPTTTHSQSIRCRSSRYKRIVNGEDAKRGQFPWVVMVLVEGRFCCGGSIIHPHYVLTAAHCVRKPYVPLFSDGTRSPFYKATDVQVIAGKHSYVISDSSHDLIREQRMSVKRVIPHDGFDDTKRVAKHNDLVILELDKAFEWTEWVSPICLPQSPNFRLPQQAIVTGWGSIHARYRLNWIPMAPRVLQQLQVKVRGKLDCRKHVPFNYTRYMTERQVCAVSLKPGNSSTTCNGDSGGPLFVEEDNGSHVQFGVLSWGYCAARPGCPSFFTYLPHFLHWISRIIDRPSHHD